MSELEAAEPERIRHNDRVLIVGINGGGKSVLARHLAEQFPRSRLTVVDPKDDGIDLGVPPARSPAELDLAAPLSHYVPTELSDGEYSELFDRLWAARGPRVILLDESYGPTRAGYAPKGLRLIVQQGRRHDMGLIACTQRPVNIESTLRTEAQHVFIFVPHPPMLDLRTLAGDMGLEPESLRRELAELLADEGEFSHLWYRRRRAELVRCAPLPAEWAA